MWRGRLIRLGVDEVQVQAVSLRSRRPSAALAPYVENYGMREARLGTASIHHPLAARSDCFLEFYLADRYRVVDVAKGLERLTPRLVLVGPHTRRREDLIQTGEVKTFTIRFTPIGFRALFGMPAYLLRDLAESADAVLGNTILELGERLAAAAEGECCAVAEEFLLERLARARHPSAGSRVASIALALQRQGGSAPLAVLAARCELSVRQVERAFQEHIGVSPKVFGRLARLKFALELSAASRGTCVDWAEVALSAGYFDQSHMAREFRALTGETPLQFHALRERAASFSKSAEHPEDVAFVLSPRQNVPVTSSP